MTEIALTGLSVANRKPGVWDCKFLIGVAVPSLSEAAIQKDSGAGPLKLGMLRSLASSVFLNVPPPNFPIAPAASAKKIMEKSKAELSVSPMAIPMVRIPHDLNPSVLRPIWATELTSSTFTSC